MDREAMSKLEAAKPSRKPPRAKKAGQESVPGDDDGMRAERDRLLEMEAEIMKLLGSSSRETIVHDLRNVLNDLTLLQELNGRTTRRG